jgi:hypothetical protein
MPGGISSTGKQVRSGAGIGGRREPPGNHPFERGAGKEAGLVERAVEFPSRQGAVRGFPV